MAKWLLIWFGMVSSLMAQTPPQDKVLLAVEAQGRCGVVDALGQTVLPCEFAAIGYWSEGLIAVAKSSPDSMGLALPWKWGYYNLEGQEVVPAVYSSVGKFSEGLAMVEQEGRYGFIDHQGNMVVSCEFQQAGDFHQGRAIVMQNGKWGYVNDMGEVVIPCTYDHVKPFDHGMAVVGRKQEAVSFYWSLYHAPSGSDFDEMTRYGLIDLDGNVVLEPQYELIGTFHEGRARIGFRYQEGFIDTLGTIVIPIEYERVFDFSEGLAVVSDRLAVPLPGYDSTRLQVLDSLLRADFPDGEIHPELLEENPIYAEFKWMKSLGPQYQERFGYINAAGELVIPMRFPWAEAFEGGWAVVIPERDGISFGVGAQGSGSLHPQNLINVRGDIMLPSETSSVIRHDDKVVFRTHDGGARLMDIQEEKIDWSGKGLLYNVGEGYFLDMGAEDSDSRLVVREGKPLFELSPGIEGLFAIDEGRMLAAQTLDGQSRNARWRWGIMDDQGKWLIEPQWDDIRVLRADQ